MKAKSILSAACVALLFHSASAATVEEKDPQAGGITYKYTVNMGADESVSFKSHVGAWSWEDNSLIDANGTVPGWTHTSNWAAFELTATSAVTITMARETGVPWPSATDANRTASIDNMYPCFTVYKGWDNDLAPASFRTPQVNDHHTYNNRGNIAWAEDLTYLDHYYNVTLTTITKTLTLPAGKYSMVFGSNAPTSPAERQGYKTTITTVAVPVTTANDLYFMPAVKPFTVTPADGIFKNDVGVTLPADVVSVVKAPTHGALTLNADGSFTFVPDQYFSAAGYDTFSYKVSPGGDSTKASVEATVVLSSFIRSAGVYVGQFTEETSGEIAGIAKLNITPTGQFTGTAQYLGNRHSVSGSFGVHGEMIIKKAPALEGELHLSTHPDGDTHLHAHIHGPEGTNTHYGAHLAKSPFSLSNPPPSVGTHKVSLTTAATTASLVAPTVQGSGTIVITADGSASFTGKTEQKAKFSGSTALLAAPGSGPVLPIYAGAYFAPGNISGTLTFGINADSGATGTLKAVLPPKGTKAGATYSYEASTTAVVKKAKK